ncbi:hypothetical protein F4819DRAFT_450637 [Hypoxylon fuscum]|nr:hypothetical protein F4819DRAFT_450637 [Hypoxylon fuscum]
MSQRAGPPYAPTTAGVGGIPSIIPDVPISATFVAFYVGFAVTNMTIYQINCRRGHKFIPTIALFGFCMARISTLVLRIVWANRPTNVRVSIAANIFANAGILIVYIINLIFAQRILRAKQPTIGWHTTLRVIYTVLFVGVGCALVLVITAVVLSVYTLDPHTLQACRDMQLTSGTYLLVFTSSPLFVIAAAYMLPRSPAEEAFGQGSMRTKVLVVSVASCLCVLNAGFKAGVAWSPPRLASNPAWYHGRASFYVFNFALEVIILCILTPIRVDKRFHVPDGCKQPGHYSGHVEPLQGSIREITLEKEERSEDTTLNNV